MDRAAVRKTIFTSIITIFILGVCILAYYESSRIIRGPEIIINSPGLYIATSSAYIVISGVIKDAVITNMNGRPIFIDQSGAFSEISLLADGENEILFYAKDRFGKEEKVIVEAVKISEIK